MSKWRFRELDIVRKRLLKFKPKRAEIRNPERRRSAAVLVSLLNIDDTASLLFTVRTHKVGTHKGHVGEECLHVQHHQTPSSSSLLKPSSLPHLYLSRCPLWSLKYMQPFQEGTSMKENRLKTQLFVNYARKLRHSWM